MDWRCLTDEQKMKATFYLDGLTDVLGHEPDTEELARYWNGMTEEEREEILETETGR